MTVIRITLVIIGVLRIMSSQLKLVRWLIRSVIYGPSQQLMCRGRSSSLQIYLGSKLMPGALTKRVFGQTCMLAHLVCLVTSANQPPAWEAFAAVSVCQRLACQTVSLVELGSNADNKIMLRESALVSVNQILMPMKNVKSMILMDKHEVINASLVTCVRFYQVKIGRPAFKNTVQKQGRSHTMEYFVLVAMQMVAGVRMWCK